MLKQLSFTVLLCLCQCIPAVLGATIVTLPVLPQRPVNASQIIDRRLASFSIELAYLPSFVGNRTHPNTLTRELMRRLEERTGVGPDVRPGGITVDSSFFDPNGPALVLDMSSSGGVYRSTYGPEFFESLSVFPNTSRFIVDVNLGNNSVDIAGDQIKAAVKYLGWERIFSLELGNEPDHFAGGSRPQGWSSADYTEQFLNWTSILTQRLSLPPRIFQAGAFADDPTPSASMTTVDIINEGIDNTGVIKLFDQHTYQYSTCDPVRNAKATLPNLINHQNITAYLDLWKPQIAAAKSRGKEFVVGEYSSVSCSGKQNVTDTFGQALWLADTVLYGASLNISRMYLHQGATLVLQSNQQANTPGFSWYDLWYPVLTERYGSARASPSFVAYLLITEAIGSSNKSQLSLVSVPSNPQLAVYAIWDPAVRTDGIARLALLNLAVRNETMSSQEAAQTSVTVDVSALMRTAKANGIWNGKRSNVSTREVKVKRMKAPGLDSKDVGRVLWAGQSYESGVPTSQESIESIQDGAVTVGGSEGALLFF